MTKVRCGETGWTKIGITCNAERRSLWLRWTRQPVEGSKTLTQTTALELCSGREGGDAHVRVDSDDPVFADLAEVLSYAEWAAGPDNQPVTASEALVRLDALERAAKRGQLDPARQDALACQIVDAVAHALAEMDHSAWVAARLVRCFDELADLGPLPPKYRKEIDEMIEDTTSIVAEKLG